MLGDHRKEWENKADLYLKDKRAFVKDFTRNSMIMQQALIDVALLIGIPGLKAAEKNVSLQAFKEYKELGEMIVEFLEETGGKS